MAPGKPWRSICVPQAARLRGFCEAWMELYLIIKAFVPGASFPELRPHGIDGCEQVARGNITPTRYSTWRSRF